MSYSIKNLTDVKDSAADFGIGEIGQARFAGESVDAEDTGFAYLALNPGKRQPFGHKHENAEEVYVVIAGGGRVRLDEEVADLNRLDALRVSPGVTRAFEAGDEGMEVLAFGAKHQGDGEIIQDFWTD
jgi:mannose-6-phosphate isomerase-like protein (cupin superfamily)